MQDDGPVDCGFDPSRSNIAIHIRLGERRQVLQPGPEYYAMLDLFMHTVTTAVEEQGHNAPMFHVFSETAEPCPDSGTGVFDEFSAWLPVEEEQVRFKDHGGRGPDRHTTFDLSHGSSTRYVSIRKKTICS